jgi:hypothetical protein
MIDKDLSFVFQPSECGTMDNTVPVPLEFIPDTGITLCIDPAF